MCRAQGPQRSDASEARTLGLESIILPLSRCAPYQYDVISNFTIDPFKLDNP